MISPIIEAKPILCDAGGLKHLLAETASDLPKFKKNFLRSQLPIKNFAFKVFEKCR